MMHHVCEQRRLVKSDQSKSASLASRIYDLIASERGFQTVHVTTSGNGKHIFFLSRGLHERRSTGVHATRICPIHWRSCKLSFRKEVVGQTRTSRFLKHGASILPSARPAKRSTIATDSSVELKR